MVVMLLGCRVEGSAQRENVNNKKYELIIYVSDLEGNAVAGIVVSNKGKGSPSNATDGSGRTVLILQGEVHPGEELDLVLLVDVKENTGWEIVPNYRPLIHAFNNNPNAHTTLVLKPNRPVRSPNLTPTDALASGKEDFQTLQSELANAYIQLGNAEYVQKRYDEAFGAYRRALEKRPDYEDALYYAALTLLQLRKYQDVLPYIEKCLEIRKGKPESLDLASSHEVYAIALSGLGRMVEAENENTLAKTIRARLPRPDNKP